MSYLFDPTAPKKATNLTVNSDLLSQAKALRINISAVLEQSLAEEVRRRRTATWLQENQKAINSYNKDVERNGVFSDGLRSF